MAPWPQKICFFKFLILFESGIFMEFWMCFEWRGLRTGCERRCGRPERIRCLRRLCTTAGWLCSVSCSENSRNSKRYSRCRKTVCTKKRSGLGDSYSGYGAPYMPAAQEQDKTIWLASESFRNSVETETPASFLSLRIVVVFPGSLLSLCKYSTRSEFFRIQPLALSIPPSILKHQRSTGCGGCGGCGSCGGCGGCGGYGGGCPTYSANTAANLVSLKSAPTEKQ